MKHFHEEHILESSCLESVYANPGTVVCYAPFNVHVGTKITNLYVKERADTVYV